jgi:hypothetical protein
MRTMLGKVPFYLISWRTIFWADWRICLGGLPRFGMRPCLCCSTERSKSMQIAF